MYCMNSVVHQCIVLLELLEWPTTHVKPDWKELWWKMWCTKEYMKYTSDCYCNTVYDNTIKTIMIPYQWTIENLLSTLYPIIAYWLLESALLCVVPKPIFFILLCPDIWFYNKGSNQHISEFPAAIFIVITRNMVFWSHVDVFLRCECDIMSQ